MTARRLRCRLPIPIINVNTVNIELDDRNKYCTIHLLLLLFSYYRQCCLRDLYDNILRSNGRYYVRDGKKDKNKYKKPLNARTSDFLYAHSAKNHITS